MTSDDTNSSDTHHGENPTVRSSPYFYTSAPFQRVRAIPCRMLPRRRRIKNFAALVAAAVPNHARGKPIELWWQDEARVGQQGSLTYVWAEKGSRPRMPRDQR